MDVRACAGFFLEMFRVLFLVVTWHLTCTFPGMFPHSGIVSVVPAYIPTCFVVPRPGIMYPDRWRPSTLPGIHFALGHRVVGCAMQDSLVLGIKYDSSTLTGYSLGYAQPTGPMSAGRPSSAKRTSPVSIPVSCLDSHLNSPFSELIARAADLNADLMLQRRDTFSAAR